MVTHTQNSCSAFNPSKVHTHSSEHTHREHTPGAVGSHLCCGTQGAVGGSVPCSRTPQSWYCGGENAVHSLPHRQFLPARDSNPQPLDYESDSLTIRPQLPQCVLYIDNECTYMQVIKLIMLNKSTMHVVI